MSENQLKNQASASVGDETSESADAVLDGDLVRDVTIAEFPQLVELSKQVPVVLDMWAPWCAPCRQLGPVLEQLVQEYAGKIVLAKVNVDEQAELAQAFRVQSVPAVFLLLDGHPAPLFTGALPASTVRAAFDKVLELAASQGVAGRLRVHEAPAESLAPRETPNPNYPKRCARRQNWLRPENSRPPSKHTKNTCGKTRRGNRRRAAAGQGAARCARRK
ncbi:thioredoxin family protein [Mobiluncus mulieris]|uniref:thioredoxin family protein n=1 Tax=Mobiluncus mulieris TaxID=2052 RepID=UPI00209346A9|nr:thioredoxin domain-containing protein [Mobiluncus mulieris]